jgi:glycosyltransferase involved in cell wall biosynthesis
MSSVSVVIPCYNYGHFLPEAVSSVLDDQKDVDVRVLIIDDGSTDDSAEVARQIVEGDSRVEAILHPTNMGHLETYNEGLLEWADGDYSVLLSADDRLTPGALGRAAELLDARPNVGFVYGHPLHFQGDRPLPLARTTVRGWSVWPGRWWL